METQKEFTVEIENRGSDGEIKKAIVTGYGITLTRYWLYNSPWRNWAIRRFVKNAKKTIREIK